MKKRPIGVTIVSWVYIVAGALELAFLVPGFNILHPLQNGDLWVGLVRLAAIVLGIYMLRGNDWARWLALVWMGGHVIVSAFASTQLLVVHGMFFVAIAYVLFRPDSTAYFRSARAEAR
jgi:cbb3-type cytochrome oxidase subunit 3